MNSGEVPEQTKIQVQTFLTFLPHSSTNTSGQKSLTVLNFLHYLMAILIHLIKQIKSKRLRLQNVHAVNHLSKVSWQFNNSKTCFSFWASESVEVLRLKNNTRMDHSQMDAKVFLLLGKNYMGCFILFFVSTRC